MKTEILERLVQQSKLALQAQKDAEKRNMKCMDLPPRARGRGGKNTTIQAKASVKATYRDNVMHDLRLLMSEFIKNY